MIPDIGVEGPPVREVGDVHVQECVAVDAAVASFPEQCHGIDIYNVCDEAPWYRVPEPDGILGSRPVTVEAVCEEEGRHVDEVCQ
jgi:hypothetical protein